MASVSGRCRTGFVGRVAQVRRLPLLDVGVVSYPFDQNSDAAEYKWNLESQDAGLSYGRVACLLIQLVATTGWLRGVPRDLYRHVGAVWCLIEEGVRLCNSYHLLIRGGSANGCWR